MAEGVDAEGSGEGYERVCSLEALRVAGRKRVTVNNGRVVVLFYVSGRVHALDHFCYREQISSYTLCIIQMFITDHIMYTAIYLLCTSVEHHAVYIYVYISL